MSSPRHLLTSTATSASISYWCHHCLLSSLTVDFGSVWIGLILLKLKTYCWNHCSKIIFKCVNSIVGPIFNEKVAKKWNLWVHEQYIMHCLLQKSQHLRLLFIEQYMNSNRVLPKRVKKKKKNKNKNKNAKRKTQIQNVNPNIHFDLEFNHWLFWSSRALYLVFCINFIFVVYFCIFCL